MGAGIVLVEILPIIIAIGLYFLMKKLKYTNLGKRFLFLILAVLLFMLMSEPMYRNPNLDAWAYLYRDVAWTVILGWADIFLVSMIIVDKVCKKQKEKIKFWWYLLVVTIITVPIESILLNTGLRAYSQVLSSTFSGLVIPLTQTPIEVLLATPIIAALIIPFYKYLSE